MAHSNSQCDLHLSFFFTWSLSDKTFPPVSTTSCHDLSICIVFVSLSNSLTHSFHVHSCASAMLFLAFRFVSLWLFLSFGVSDLCHISEHFLLPTMTSDTSLFHQHVFMMPWWSFYLPAQLNVAFGQTSFTAFCESSTFWALVSK